MANYKLTNNYWETSGIYDIGQGKTQREINNQIINDIQTESVVDKVPYAFRKTGGDNTVGKRENDKLVGGTVVWNQVAKALTNSNWAAEFNAAVQYSDGIASLTPTEPNGRISQTITYIANHKLFLSADIKLSVTDAASNVRVSVYGASTSINASATTDWQTLAGFVSFNSSASSNRITITDARTSNWGTTQIKNVLCCDLTAMFGSTIADYIYGLETATKGAGVAYFRSLFPNSYYAYNSGTLMSVNAASHETVGFNQWDEQWEVGNINTNTGEKTSYSNLIRSKNYIPIDPEKEYYLNFWYSISGSGLKVCFYDSQKQFISGSVRYTPYFTKSNQAIPANARYMLWAAGVYRSTYDNDVCINFFDSAKNGTYEPYTKHTYPLDSTLTLRGIPKLDSNNKLYYDGDTYTSDGTVKRKYSTIVLDGTENWSGGSNLFYWSTNSTNFPYKQVANVKALSYSEYSFYGTKADSYSSALSNNEFLLYCPSGSSNTTREIAFKDTSVTGYEAWKQKLANNPITIIYEKVETTESASPYTNPQICDGSGTEEYVDAGVLAEERDVSVPVGHDTEYMTETASNAAGWDTDYSTMIAPTEKDFTATRAYSVNNLFIVSGQLYKATSPIASGAAITVGTNATPTTIGELLTQLLNT